MLKDIINLVSEETALNASDERQRTLLVKHINLTALRLYNKSDLLYSLIDEDFNTSVGSAIITMPPYVGEIRLARYINGRHPITMGDQRQRYHVSGQNDAWTLKYFDNGYSALGRDIDNEGTLTFSIPIAENNDIVLIVKGCNNNSASVVEKVVIKAGDLTASTINPFREVEEILKEEPNTYNIVITDIEGKTLASFPNNQLKLRHQRVRLFEAVYVPDVDYTSRAIEVCYKKAFTWMIDDYDSFCKDAYDQIILWEYLRTYVPDKKDLADSNLDRMEKDLIRNREKGKWRKIDAAPNPYVNVARSGTHRRVFRFNRVR